MEKLKILLVEDDLNLGFILEENLELQGFSVKRCQDGEEGYLSFLDAHYDLCLIDVMLPVKDGFTLAKDIRKTNYDIPIIFLTAKSLKEDRIEGFKIGGDDYITKPFSMEELKLRIKAVLKRSQKATTPELLLKEFQIGKYIFKPDDRLLILNNESNKLTYKESELLKLLCINLNQALERDIALKKIWEEDSFFNARSMDVFITKLRKHLSKDPSVEIINIHGKGFKLMVKSET